METSYSYTAFWDSHSYDFIPEIKVRTLCEKKKTGIFSDITITFFLAAGHSEKWSWTSLSVLFFLIDCVSGSAAASVVWSRWWRRFTKWSDLVPRQKSFMSFCFSHKIAALISEFFSSQIYNFIISENKPLPSSVIFFKPTMAPICRRRKLNYI